ncbi:aggregation-promoting factor C-terminal-like domain-containing protein [Tenggerimyces flavus]|uniref:Lytic transglycosylase domain-containing protein n=1 Tax=Tenggerimyces flavus TaxID=1708749 RepID=A0ABV7Y6R3_9ACTN|nr:hypothetical protein [Tenggerimyces flavus]MBM7791033.1 hypothetical protein [Tenggerimyces flavus]
MGPRFALPKLPSLDLGRKGLKPTLAAVTCASVGVAGVGVTAAVVATAKGQLAQDNTLLADQIKVPGPLTSATRARLADQKKQDDKSTTAAKASTAVTFEEPQAASGVASFDRTRIERQRAIDRASRDKERVFAEGTPKEIAKVLVIERGWSERQYNCLVPMWRRESNWNHLAENKSSGAYGIAQALPGRKMAKFGDDWRTNPVTQIKWGLWYIENRYGTPCGAWSFWQRNHWY